MITSIWRDGFYNNYGGNNFHSLHLDVNRILFFYPSVFGKNNKINK